MGAGGAHALQVRQVAQHRHDLVRGRRVEPRGDLVQEVHALGAHQHLAWRRATLRSGQGMAQGSDAQRGVLKRANAGESLRRWLAACSTGRAFLVMSHTERCCRGSKKIACLEEDVACMSVQTRGAGHTCAGALDLAAGDAAEPAAADRLSRRPGSASAFMNASTAQSTSMPAAFSRRRISLTSSARMPCGEGHGSMPLNVPVTSVRLPTAPHPYRYLSPAKRMDLSRTPKQGLGFDVLEAPGHA